MIDLSELGKFFRTYSGSGRLCFKANRELNCNFKVAQLSDGRLYASCEILTSDFSIDVGQKVESLSGRTDDGTHLDLQQLLAVSTRISSSTKGASEEILLLGKKLTVTGGAFTEGPVTFKFFVTNLTIGSLGQELSQTLDGFALTIHRVPSYDEIVRGLKAIQVDVTCEVLVRADSIEQRDTILQLLRRICLLLTLARGCRVEWIGYEVTMIGGQVIESFHKNAITKPYGTLTLIGLLPAQDTLDFINTTYPALARCEQEWELGKAINAYTDAKVEVDFLEFRALKMVIVMEHLKGKYLTQQNRVYLINPTTYQRHEESLIRLVEWMLRTLFPKVETEKIELMARHAQGLNWYPFGRALADLCKSIRLRTNSSERRKFVEIRNDLVHRMTFHPSRGTEWEQYVFLMTFIGKTLLAILGYDGNFYDWTEPPGWIGEQMHMRKRLDLVPKESL